MRRLALSVDGDAAGYPRLDEIASWLRSLGLRALVPGRSHAPPPAARFRETLSGVALPAVRHVFPMDGGSREGDLAGREIVDPAHEVRERAVERLVATARFALAAPARGAPWAPWVIVEPGSLEPFPAEGDAQSRGRERDARLERLCRGLHAAARREPLARFALATPRDPQPWLTPADLDDAFGELAPRDRFAYWHDAGRARAFAAMGMGPEPAWLDRHAARCAGVDATDAVGSAAGLPAGAGEVDFKALLGAVGSSTWIVVRSEPLRGAGPLLAALRHLERPLERGR